MSVKNLKDLQIENEKLRREISTLKKIVEAPLDEKQRTIHFRYQIYSLEKQIALLTRLLDVKREAVATSETILLELIQSLQDFKGKIHRKVPIDEVSIQNWIDRIENQRKKSYKSMQDHSNLKETDTMYAPNSMKFSAKESIHLLDVCSGKIEHLNLKNIANLENSLDELYANLRTFQHELNDQTNYLIFPNFHRNLVERSKDLATKIQQTNNELFYLSILVPTRNQKCSFASDRIRSDLICQRINSQFRLSPNIKIYLQTMFDALITGFNHEMKLMKIESNLQRKQLEFYRNSLTKFQCEHVQNLVEILSNGQKLFNEQLQKRYYEPLVNIIKEFHRLNNEKSDEALKSFIFTFKIHLDQFNEIVHELYEQINDGSKGVEQLFIETNKQMWKQIETEQKLFNEQIEAIRKQSSTSTSSLNSFERDFLQLEIN